MNPGPHRRFDRLEVRSVLLDALGAAVLPEKVRWEPGLGR